ncbi:MAG: hypothetical protein JSW04_11525 [Desulfobacterales bacterium]|nr:MAG: hypothetical protein JSW04_11525 [Desulfobacterales bacterium]
MLKKLKEKIFGKTPTTMDHEFFGKIVFMGGNIPDENDYWECEIELEKGKDPIGILITAGIEGPSFKQVEFCKDIISNLDKLFDKCWPIFEPDFEEWTGKTFSGNWRDDFKLMDISIPKDANIKNKWSVCYFVDAANHYFTANFENGSPKLNIIDG